MTQPAEPAPPKAVLPPVDSLPDSVQRRLITWAAAALGRLPLAQIPGSLIRVARFTPAKRARLGNVALASAIQNDTGFRALVAAEGTAGAQPADSRVPDTSGDSAVVTGHDGAADPVASAARAYLLALPEADELLEAVRLSEQSGPAAPETAALRAQIRLLTKQLKIVTAERDEALSRYRDADSADADKLRARLRDQGTRLRQAQLAAEQVAQSTADQLAALRAEANQSKAEAAHWQELARSAATDLERTKESLARARAATTRNQGAADRRLELLLSTLEGAAMGLRREWALSSGGLNPADMLTHIGSQSKTADGAESAGIATAVDPARLQSWLALPGVHLIVDGYNVTKTGYSELTLNHQRQRLTAALSALASRTSSEVTVVFDGAGVAVSQPPTRGVRVLFSPPGVIADDVIVDLVAAEPTGRVIVVASSDGLLGRRVRAKGARTATSDALLALTGS